VTEARVLAQLGVVVTEMHRVVVPVLQADHGQRGTLPHDELNIVRVSGRASVVKHYHAPCVMPDFNRRVTKSHPGGVVPAHRDNRGFGDVGLGRHRDDPGFTEPGKRLRTDPVAGYVGGADPGVAALRQHSGDTRSGIDLGTDLPRGKRTLTVQ